MRKIKIIMWQLVLLFITVNILSAGEISTGYFNDIAIEGYDPVAYHLLGTQKKGNTDFNTRWKNSKWYFMSKKNLNLFLSNPEKYAPRYGGHCANGLSDGHKVKGNVNHWRIHKGKLYLFYSKRGRDSWNIEIEKQILLADEYWKQVKYD